MNITSTLATGCPAGLEKIFSGDWPGTSYGCDCVDVPFCDLRNVFVGFIETQSCDLNETLCGCKTVSPVSASDFWLWPTNNRYCVQRDPSISYKNTYMNMNTDGTCKPNFKRCGEPT